MPDSSTREQSAEPYAACYNSATRIIYDEVRLSASEVAWLGSWNNRRPTGETSLVIKTTTGLAPPAD